MRYSKAMKIGLFGLMITSLLFLTGCFGFFTDWFAPLPAPEIPEPQVQVEEIISKEISAVEGSTIVVTEEMSLWSAGFELIIPPGALAADTVISVGDVIGDIPPSPEGYILIGHSINLEPSGLAFQQSVTIRIPRCEWEGNIPPEDILLKKYDERLNRWISVPIKHVQDGTSLCW